MTLNLWSFSFHLQVLGLPAFGHPRESYCFKVSVSSILEKSSVWPRPAAQRLAPLYLLSQNLQQSLGVVLVPTPPLRTHLFLLFICFTTLKLLPSLSLNQPGFSSSSLGPSCTTTYTLWSLGVSNACISRRKWIEQGIWCIHRIPAFRMLRQEGQEFKARLGCIKRAYLN